MHEVSIINPHLLEANWGWEGLNKFQRPTGHHSLLLLVAGFLFLLNTIVPTECLVAYLKIRKKSLYVFVGTQKSTEDFLSKQGNVRRITLEVHSPG